MKETLQDLKERRSCRSFLPQQVKEEQLNAILEAGTYAPTGMGMQSPVIVVVQKPELVAKLSKMNAAIMGRDMDPFYGAPCVLVVLADTQRPTYVYDGALVMGNLMNAAQAVGIPEHYEGIGNCVLGYRAPGGVKEAAPRKGNYIVRV